MNTATAVRPAYRRVDIVSPATDAEWAEARVLLREMLDWLEEVSGVPVASVQPRAMRELEALAEFYVPPEGAFFLSKVDGEAVGTTAIHRLSLDIFELKRVYVRPAARGLGLAAKMLDAAMEQARKLGARALVLESHPEVMRTAVALYRRRGFKEISPYSDLSTKVDGVITMGITLHKLRNR